MSAITNKLHDYARLARLEKPVGWLLLLWPTMWALFSAMERNIDWTLVSLFLAGVVATRSMGCCINDIVDRKLDAKVKRTQSRPLASGAITINEAIIVTLFFAVIALSVWFRLTTAAKIWSLVALAVAVSYPFAKRYFKVPQLHLCVAFGFGIPIAFVQVTAQMPFTAWILFAANFCWIFSYDTIYALVDRDDDLKVGVNSSAIWLGDNAVLAISLGYFLMLALLMVYGILVGLQITFFLVVGMGFYLAYRYTKLAAKRDRQSCTTSFRLNHWLGALVLAGIIAGDVAGKWTA